MPLVVFLTFVLAGPALGSVFVILETWAARLSGLSANHATWGPMVGPGLDEAAALVFVSYVLGGAQAFLTGSVAVLSFGLTDYARVSYRAVFASAVICGLLSCAFFRVPGVGLWLAALTIHIGAASACWLIATRLIRAFGKPLSPSPDQDAFYAAACTGFEGTRSLATAQVHAVPEPIKDAYDWHDPPTISCGS